MTRWICAGLAVYGTFLSLLRALGMIYLASWRQRNNIICKTGSVPVGVETFGFEMEDYGVFI